MVKCNACGLEMADDEKTTCTITTIKLNDGYLYQRDTSHFGSGERCRDCNIVNKKGNVHHLGCDTEICPKCRDQLFLCGC